MKCSTGTVSTVKRGGFGGATGPPDTVRLKDCVSPEGPRCHDFAMTRAPGTRAPATGPPAPGTGPPETRASGTSHPCRARMARLTGARRSSHRAEGVEKHARASRRLVGRSLDDYAPNMKQVRRTPTVPAENPHHWVPRHWVPRHWVPRHWVPRHWVPRHWVPRHWVPRHWVPRHWVPRHWVRWLAAAVIVIAALAVGGPFIYIHFVAGKAPTPFSLGKKAPRHAARPACGIRHLGSVCNVPGRDVGRYEWLTGRVPRQRGALRSAEHRCRQDERHRRPPNYLRRFGDRGYVHRAQMATIKSDQCERDVQSRGRIMDTLSNGYLCADPPRHPPPGAGGWHHQELHRAR